MGVAQPRAARRKNILVFIDCTVTEGLQIIYGSKLGSERRVMGDLISRIANFLGFYQVSVYTIYINTISLCSLA